MAKSTIVIDAGHGGFDPGAVYGNVKEKDLNLLIATEVHKLLKAAGLNSIMTRNGDTTVGTKQDTSATLIARVKKATDVNADFFLSIHNDSGKGTGSAIYIADATEITKSVATQIVDGVVKIMGAHGSPLKTADYYVIRKNQKAALLEVGFVDTPDDVAKIKANLSSIAKAIASPIINRFGGAPTTQKGQTDYDSHMLKSSIVKAIDAGIITAYNGSFRPDDGVSRAELAAILDRAGLLKKG